MHTTTSPPSDLPAEPALRISDLLRQETTRHLSRTLLSQLADVPVNRIEAYDQVEDLPEPVADLLALSLALDLPFEMLVSPAVFEELHQRILERKQRLGLF